MGEQTPLHFANLFMDVISPQQKLKDLTVHRQVQEMDAVVNQAGH